MDEMKRIIKEIASDIEVPPEFSQKLLQTILERCIEEKDNEKQSD